VVFTAWMNRWRPKYTHELTREQHKYTLVYLIFLKEKRDGSTNGQACVCDSLYQATISKEDTALPMVASESMCLTSLIAAWEKRDTRSYGQPSAFVNTDFDEEVDMVLRVDLAELIVKVALHIYCKYSSIIKIRQSYF